MKSITEIKVPAEVAPFMEHHGKRATDAITKYLSACPTLDEKLGALGVLAHILLAYGDALQARQLQKISATRA